MSWKCLLLSVLTASSLAGCQPQAGQSTQSESWYLEHRDERKQRLWECNDNPAMQRSSDCLNAMAAERRSMRSGQRELQH